MECLKCVLTTVPATGKELRKGCPFYYHFFMLGHYAKTKRKLCEKKCGTILLS
jgi:hypothetical protein